MPSIALGFFVLLPVPLPAALASHAVHGGRLRRAARAFSCVTCGHIPGTEALRRADAAWSGHMAGLVRRHAAGVGEEEVSV